jgi:hypothetical protein
MTERIVHCTPIPVLAYEYRLPLREVPAEADPEWKDWISVFVGLDQNRAKELVQRRFRDASAELLDLSNRVTEFSPFSILVYEGTPLVWLEQTLEKRRDLIYLPPESNASEVAAALEPFQLDSHRLLVEFLMLFGGMGELRPWEANEFAGRRRRGKTTIVPATEAIDGGNEYRSEAEVQERQRRFSRWIGGIELLTGDDGRYWHIGADGSVCQHDLGCSLGGYLESLPEMITSFVTASKEDRLFEGAYDGLPNLKHPA